MIRAKSKKQQQAEAPIDPSKLKSYVERIEFVEQEIVEQRGARADIYTEVKASGMKPKMVRKIIKERAKKEEDEAEKAELERYRAALAMPGATYRSVAAKMDVPRSTLHRLVPKNARGTEPPHDPDTGEVIETGSAPVVATGKEGCGPGVPDNRIAVSNGLAGMPQSRTPHSPPQPGACTTDAATTQDAADHDPVIPPFLRRTRDRGEGNGVPSAARPDRGCSEAGEGTR